MSTPPPSKRPRHSPSVTNTTSHTTANTAPAREPELPPIQQSIAPKTPLNIIPPAAVPATPISPTSPTNPRKRRAPSRSPKLDTLPPGKSLPSEPSTTTNVSIPSLLSGLSEESASKKRGRTNTPWTAAEEQRLKQMRDAGNSWGDIAKAFPNRTEGSVKKHWYKDMHYAEFAEDESVALREAIKEYEANKWKAIGQKLGKPAKACEQYAREHFRNL